MRLGRRALIMALATLTLSAVVSAQTLRLPEDPRNQSPAVGTGGPEGGATGLFTIYDGSTIRRGEFTFSVAYSNFDRDPGNADIVDTPLSFNVGLNDHIELFFKTNGYRGIKVNSPQNLSSFYLPNTQLFFGAALRCSGGAVIIAPDRVSGTGGITGRQVRPPGLPCNVGGQPFVQFPFVGGTGPNFGLTGNNIAPPYTSRLGVPSPGNGSFGSASNFPGIGSPVGSIVPGIVLSQRTIPANLTFQVLTVPNTFTIAPSYLPDAPFISRLYGESSFTNLVLGAKIRFASPTHAIGYGIIPFYRWYPDNADDFTGFNQMQRGVGPGAQLGDFGLVGFFDARLSQHVNVSVNGQQNAERFGGALPGGFQPSDDPNGFIGQFWIGRRNPRTLPPPRNQPPTVSVSASMSSVMLPCLSGTGGESCSASSSRSVELTVAATVYEARPWNRSSYYSVNNPLRHLTVVMFVWHRDVSEQDRQRIRLTLKRGPEHVKKICTLFGADSFACSSFKEAFDSFGPEGVDNGVTLSVGPTQTKGAGAETSVLSCAKWTKKTKDNPTGQRTLVTFTKETVNSDGLITLVWHEGSHVADGWKWRASGCKRSSNPSLYETEFKALTVASLSAQAYKPDGTFAFSLPGGGPPGKSPFLPETLTIYRPDLNAKDLNTLRDSSIDKLLARPTNAGGLYGVTAKSPGILAFGSQSTSKSRR